MSAPEAAPLRSPLRSILVGTDFSKPSQLAVRKAARLARERGSRLVVVHGSPAVPKALARALLGSTSPVGKDELGALAAELRAEGLRVDAKLVDARPVQALAEVAEQVDAGLLVVGARGRAIADGVLGSTAERIVEATRRPTLVVRGRRAHERVAVATDLGAELGRALDAARLVSPSARVEVLHVYEAPFEATLRYAGVDRDALDDHRREARATARRALEERLRKLDARPDAIVLRHGDPRLEIARAVERRRYDLVVLARGRSRARHALLGSVSRWVLRESKVDVLLV